MYRTTEDGNSLYLLLQAAPGKPWGFAKGKVDAGETDEVAARREIAEEAGLTDITLEPGFHEVIKYVYRRGHLLVRKEVVYFLARTTTTEVHLSWEHVAFRWATYEDARALVIYENSRELLRKAREYQARRHALPSGD